MPQHICQHCNKQFLSARKVQKYCSIYCYSQSKRQHPDTKCPVCGIIFATHLSRGKGTIQVFCCQKCRIIGVKNPDLMATRKCANCGKEFHLYKNKIKRESPRGIYCCKKCLIESQRNPAAYATKQCMNCNKLFEVLISQVEHRGGGKYCSNKCRVEYCIGENHPRWKENKVQLTPGKNWYFQRRKALERDGYKCQYCGISRNEKNRIDVHHIIPYRQFNGDYEQANKLKNLITLCWVCHRKVESHKIPCPIPNS